MDLETLAEYVFETDRNIRYVAVLDKTRDRFLLSEMRKGVVSVTEEQTDRETMSMYPPIILRAVERLEPHLGSFTGIMVRYQKVVLVFYRLARYMVIISFQSTVQTLFLERVGEVIRRFENSMRR